MNTYVEKLIKEKAITDLDMKFPFYNGAVRNEVLFTDESRRIQAMSIDINEMIGVLQSFKQEGVDRVAIETLVDNHGYYILGMELKEI